MAEDAGDGRIWPSPARIWREEAGGEVRRDITVDGVRYRVLTVGLGRSGGAIRIARSLAIALADDLPEAMAAA